MDSFLPYSDDLGRRINSVALEFYNKLNDLGDVSGIGLSERVLTYFQNSHFQRQFFSVQTAAELLYRSIKMTGKEPQELILMDYGAGVGSLYLMAKLLGCRKVIHGDIMEDMHDAGQKVARAMNIHIDEYILGDHNKILQQLDNDNIRCDLILSRNVIEHIYDLEDFYRAMMHYQPDAIHYASTTANFHNPAMLLFHRRIHKEAESRFFKERCNIIQNKFPEWPDSKIETAALHLRGLAGKDMYTALDTYAEKSVLPDPKRHYTNTCDPLYGVWAEHIIPVREYRELLEPMGYDVDILPAFWDTHYPVFYKNWLGRTMNLFTKILGSRYGLKTTAFIYIILKKR